MNAEDNVLTLTEKITLPNVSGRIDHIAYDSINHLAFVAALGNNTIEVVNIETKQVVHTIKGLHEPQGVVYIPALQKLVVANGDNGECIFFEPKNYTQLSSVNLKGDADNIRYDAATNLLYAGYGSGGIAIINAGTMKQVASILLDGHPESFQLSKKENHIYINVPDADEIEVADLSSHLIIAKWKNTNASFNFPMALDEENHRIFVACRSPATLRMIDTQTGKDIQSINCSGDADDIFYDPARHRIYISGGEGSIWVLTQQDADHYPVMAKISTASGARTSLYVPAWSRLYLAVPHRASQPAEIRVYQAQ